MHTRQALGCLLITGLLAAAAREAPAATWYVAMTGSDSVNNGTGGWTQAYATLSNAVVRANTNASSVVWVSNGTYTVTVEVAVTNGIRVRSWNNGAVDRENTLISGGGAVRGFNVNHTGAVLEGLTVTNGAAPTGYGGGIYLTAGLVTNCVLIGNWATNGGGIYLGAANATLKNSMIAGNAASNVNYYEGGGGIYLEAGVVTNCVISNNVAARSGGGVHISGGKLTDSEIVTNRILSGGFGYDGGGVLVYNNSAATVANCTIMGNAYDTNNVEGGGGGVALVSGGLVTNCVIAYNRSGNCGGVYFQGTGNQVVDCLISNNTAYTLAGGIQYYAGSDGLLLNCRVIGNTASTGNGGGVLGSSSSRVRNTLFTGNSAAGSGGGAYLLGGYVDACTIVSNTAGAGGGIMFVIAETAVSNSIIFSNKNGAAWGDLGFFAPGTGSLYYSCTPVTNGCLVANNCVTNSPQYVNFETGDFRLAAGSPCINAGTNEAWMGTAVDLDRHARIDRFSGKVDIGCYEFLPQGALFRGH